MSAAAVCAASDVWGALRAGDALVALASAGPVDLEWAGSGAMALAGDADGPPLLAPAPLASAARAGVALLEQLTDRPLALDGPALLGERAACLGLVRAGATAPSGSCRLLPARDGWLAVNLARPEDLASLPAWLGVAEVARDAWPGVVAAVARGPVAGLVERARLLGMPVSAVAAAPPGVAPWCRVAAQGVSVRRAPAARPRVVDLTSLWAGPLCTHLLQLAGADVVKVESARRPDGARRGDRRFFDLLNAGKRSVSLDFSDPGDRRALARLLRGADVVVESARPRALRQLGIDAERLVRERAGLTWLALSGHGRTEPGAGWVAFGDDATAAGGLCQATGAPGQPRFCGDAIADPLAGIHAAVAALASFRAGGGHLLDVSLAGVVAHLVAQAAAGRARVVRDAGEFAVEQAGTRVPVRPPRARASHGRARGLGADNATELAAC